MLRYKISEKIGFILEIAISFILAISIPILRVKAKLVLDNIFNFSLAIFSISTSLLTFLTTLNRDMPKILKNRTYRRLKDISISTLIIMVFQISYELFPNFSLVIVPSIFFFFLYTIFTLSDLILLLIDLSKREKDNKRCC